MSVERNVHPFDEIVDAWVTEAFLRAWRKLSPQLQEIIKVKVALLRVNPRHPMLRSHRIRRTDGVIWECYVNYSYRMLYQYKDDRLLLFDVGRHSVVDRVHLRNFSTA